MKKQECKSCRRVAYISDGERLIVNGKEVENLPPGKAKISFACFTPNCKAWVHWEKKI